MSRFEIVGRSVRSGASVPFDSEEWSEAAGGSKDAVARRSIPAPEIPIPQQGKLGQLAYLPAWFIGARFMGKTNPLQTVLFVSNHCNLACKHCDASTHSNTMSKSYDQIREELEYSYSIGSRFVDFEGGEPTIWHDGHYGINDLISLARNIGFFSTTVTTNAQLPFDGLEATSIWVSLDGTREYHDQIRGAGTFDRALKNIAASGHKAVSVNMTINCINKDCVEDLAHMVAENPHIKSISFSFHTPYPGTEHMMLPWDQREQVLDKIIAMKKAGVPIMNSVSGLELMKTNDFPKDCWVCNFILTDGTRLSECPGKTVGICDQCGFGMGAEMRSVFQFKPDTILAGLDLRVS